MTKTQKQIVYEHLRANPSSTTDEIARNVGISKNSTASAITQLMKEGAIRVSSKELVGGVGRYTNRYTVGGLRQGKRRTNQEVLYETLLIAGPSTLTRLSKLTGLGLRPTSSAMSMLRKAGKVEVSSQERTDKALVYTYRAVEYSNGAALGSVTKRAMKNGGGPFGLMAAQLGV